MPNNQVSMTIAGRAHAPQLPTLLVAAQRAFGAADDPFLPRDFLRPTGLFDVAPATRSADASTQTHDTDANDLMALEMADGSTLITSAAALRASLDAHHPLLIGPDGQVLLDQLCADAATPQRGLGSAVGSLVRRVYTFALNPSPDKIIEAALDLLRRQGRQSVELGISWLGTKALMAAIESQLKAPPGLHRWTGNLGRASDLAPTEPITGTAPMLVFVHGTASNTLGSFGDLRAGEASLWSALEARFKDRIYAFEHRTLSESPIENAIALVQALPVGAQVSLVSHSRGGLVADLLCLGDFDALIAQYAHVFEGTGDADPAEAARVKAELRTAHAAQRQDLQRLAQLLRERQITVQRYVRTASPANGTKLASANFDLFLSGLLTLVGAVPGLFGSPLYSAFKRVVIEIARNRTNPHLVPGIEAMLPDSPMARLLRDAPVRPGIAMSTIAGDIQGGPLLQRLGVMLTDLALFDRDDNDLVVNTTAMLAGVAPSCQARVLFDRGPDVSHFRYFSNADTRNALRDWLVCPDPLALPQFQPLPAPADYAAALQAASAASRDAGAADRPVVLVLPGIMGSHLRAGNRRVWLDPLQLAAGKLADLAWHSRLKVNSEALFAMSYGEVCEHLARTHRVETFPYDWRQPLDVLADRLSEHLARLLQQTKHPVRLLAHSMGGLVVRACIHKHRALMDALMARDGARLVMAGTPHQGAHSMVANLIGKGDTLRALVRLDLAHDMQAVLDIVAGFPGALQLLPRPGFIDEFQGQPDGGAAFDYQQATTWATLKTQATDLWFGNQRAGTPSQATLDAASWLWRADAEAGGPALPDAYASKSIYVFGVAANTPCGVRLEDSKPGQPPRLRLVGTTRGDGTVTWQSGRIAGIGQHYYLSAAHGDLLATRDSFDALTELLTQGRTTQLATTPPAVRAAERERPLHYDAPAPSIDDTDVPMRQLLGSSPRARLTPRAHRRLAVAARAMDLRFVTHPILVGHYEQDPIAGAEALVDSELLHGDLGERYRLGLYASRRGEATVVLRRPNGQEAARGSLTGAVVTGLGAFERPLSPASLTEAVRVGALRYLLQAVDVLGEADRELPLATLLLGYNSSANLTVAASVEALVRGVLEANERFFHTTGLNLRIAQLEIVELYLDTAISAAYALRDLGTTLHAQALAQKTELVCHGELLRGPGCRPRLFDGSSASYWPRLIITRADSAETAQATSTTTDSPPTAMLAAPVADQLRFIYVGQRARAETVALQRQPGLVEALVARQIGNPQWDETFGRALFQLMVPFDFKDAARQLARVVLVVDAHTANLPWELMLADDPSRPGDDRRPLALRTAVVRQLSSSSYRPAVRQGTGRSALVIGNPSLDGFSAAFSTDPLNPLPPPDPLPGAEAEAEAAQGLLSAAGFEVTALLGTDWPAHALLPRLYEQPWRVLHISAHGVFGLPHVDGRPRSGVLLSDGLLITAAEIAAMECVPELVFLNCCHLGQVDGGRQHNKLAASVARELIEVGVRCVIVAGWAVNDQSAKAFAVSFYEHLLLRHQPFGDAVFEARQAAWAQQPDDITWGAFQAYGDPAWRVDPQAAGQRAASTAEPFVSPDELLDELACQRTRAARRATPPTAAQRQARAETLHQLLKQRCPAPWLTMPAVQSALATTWYELGDWARAREAFLAALQANTVNDPMPMRDIELLANAEVRLADQWLQQALSADAQAAVDPQAEALIQGALQRLSGLEQLAPTSAERSALIGSAWKRLAALEAQRLLQRRASARPDTTQLDAHLQRSQAAYRSAEGTPGSAGFNPYHALNRLALQAAGGPTARDTPSRQADLTLARHCATHATAAFATSTSPWDAVMPAEALLVEHLLQGHLGQAGLAGEQHGHALARQYDDALAQVPITPTQLDSVVSQLRLLARLIGARATVLRLPALRRTTQRLQALAHHLQPGETAPAELAAAAPRPARRRPPSAQKPPASKVTKATEAAKAKKASQRRARPQN